MNIQSKSTTTPLQTPSFQRLIIKRGSFEALRASKYFPSNKNNPIYDDAMHNFYKSLLQLKRRADNNDLYNVVIKPEKSLTPGNTGKVVIESKEGREQEGFKLPFSSLLKIHEFEPQKLLTKDDVSNVFVRWYRNIKIAKRNKKIINDSLDFRKFLSIIYKRVEEMVKNAECLSDLRYLHEGKRKEL